MTLAKLAKVGLAQVASSVCVGGGVLNFGLQLSITHQSSDLVSVSS